MRISKEFHFSAAHWLPRHKGKCRNLHGHNYLVVVELDGELDPETQFVMDFSDLKDLVDPIIERWDHKCLNSFVRYSSAENLAAHLADLIRAKLEVAVDQLVVRVSETPKTWAVWDSKNKVDMFMLDRAKEDAEWKSPVVDIPILPTVNAYDRVVSQQDADILHALRHLQELMTVREQTALYSDSLDENPELPEEVQKAAEGGAQ